MFVITGSPRRTSRVAVTHTATAPVTASHAPVLFMAALCNRGAIIFLPCSFFLLLYGRPM